LDKNLKIPYVDAHCHVYNISPERLRKIKDMVIVGVSEDLETSKIVIKLAKKIPNIIPMVGIHPWLVKKTSYKELQEVVAMISEARGFGEIGLDGKVGGKEKQMDFLERFLEVAEEYNVPINLHARASWREVVGLVLKYNIKKAIFHWYSGPTELLRDMEANGYYITINPSVIFQNKHLRVLEKAPMSMILTESDGPYQYRGKFLTPADIPNLVRFISRVKNVPPKIVRKTVYENIKNIFSMDLFHSGEFSA